MRPRLIGIALVALALTTIEPYLAIVRAAIALEGADTTIDSTGTDVVTVSFTMPSVSDGCLTAGFAYIEGQTLNTVTYNGDSLTQSIYTRDTVSTGAVASIWTIKNPDAGTFNLVATFSGNVAVSGTIQALSGCHQTTLTGTGTGDFGTVTAGNSIDTDVSSASGELVIDALYASSGNSTAGANQTEIANFFGGSSAVRFGSSWEAGAGTVTMSWSTDSNPIMVISAIPIKPSGGAAPVPCLLTLLGVGKC